MPKSTSKTLKVPKPSKPTSKTSSKSSTKSPKVTRKTKPDKVVSGAENPAITNTVFEDTLRQENLSREFIRQITGSNETGPNAVPLDPKVDLTKGHLEPPKLQGSKPDGSIFTGSEVSKLEPNVRLPSAQADIPKVQPPTSTELDVPKLEKEAEIPPNLVEVPTGKPQIKKPSIPTGIENPKVETSGKLLTGQVDMPVIQPKLQAASNPTNDDLPKLETSNKVSLDPVTLPKVQPELKDVPVIPEVDKTNVALRQKNPATNRRVPFHYNYHKLSNTGIADNFYLHASIIRCDPFLNTFLMDELLWVRASLAP
ncbi:hypothetical protein T265_08041 [Opisthorchis viverrini]|uniref:Uncharacterized protein n=1 Tax=Opisthorchis viverrini TaxID=6198 RepID=A0A075A9Q0_OPIVI|nr:hypothetical protein T265_08041 [Opisthorchis viverrini]KER24249.1 hypothetical protein T265_08041 [Opisthorchis viverrini]